MKLKGMPALLVGPPRLPFLAEALVPYSRAINGRYLLVYTVPVRNVTDEVNVRRVSHCPGTRRMFPQ